jgi:hypothetical protein
LSGAPLAAASANAVGIAVSTSGLSRKAQSSTPTRSCSPEIGENSGSSDSFWTRRDHRVRAVADDDEPGSAIGVPPDEVAPQGVLVDVTVDRGHGHASIGARHDVAPGAGRLHHAGCHRRVRSHVSARSPRRSVSSATPLVAPDVCEVDVRAERADQPGLLVLVRRLEQETVDAARR